MGDCSSILAGAENEDVALASSSTAEGDLVLLIN